MSINELLEQAHLLKPLEKLQLIDELLLSLDEPDKELEKIWTEEAEKRLEAYEAGKIKAIDAKEVFQKYGL